MDRIKVLWVDLRFIQDKASFDSFLNEDWKVSHINDTDQIVHEICESAPELLCFEYDFPDIISLSALQKVSCLFPSIPIIMLTEQHSETMAIWALRVHVWDYFVKPIQPKELMMSMNTILELKDLPKDEMAQQRQLTNPVPNEVRFRHYKKNKTYLAQAYIESYYHEKIYAEKMAQLCRMNTTTFSRSFKKEYGTTFRSYLINYRISKAKELLKHPHAMVTDISYTVDFDDPSYFTRTFGRLVGKCPSRFHEEHKKTINEENLEIISISL